MKEPKPQDWSPYWQRPTITSFGGIFPNSYDGEILEFWKRQLSAEFDHVADVACGNEALTWISDEILNQGARKTRITGKVSAVLKRGERLAGFPDALEIHIG